MNDDTDNPYQAPESNIIPEDSRAEEIRSDHIQHEASIKSVGALYYLGAVIIILVSITTIIPGISENTLMPFVLGGFFLLMGIAQFWTAGKLRQLSPAARVPTTIFSVVGLVGFPVGTLINAYILYLIYCKKGRFILTQEYQQIVEATPEIKHRTSVLIWIFFGLLILLLGAAIVMPMFNH